MTLRCTAGNHAALCYTGVTESLYAVFKVLRLRTVAPANWPKTAPWPAWVCTPVQPTKCDQGLLLPGQECLIPDQWLAPFSPGAEEELRKANFTAKLGGVQ
jgi:hypothetical protein